MPHLISIAYIALPSHNAVQVWKANAKIESCVPFTGAMASSSAGLANGMSHVEGSNPKARPQQVRIVQFFMRFSCSLSKQLEKFRELLGAFLHLIWR